MASLWNDSSYDGQPVDVTDYSMNASMTSAIASACVDADDNDLTYIYVATHADANSHSRILTSGAHDSMTFVDFFRQLNQYRGRFVVIVDSCYSGTAVDVADAGERVRPGGDVPDYAVDADRFFVLSAMDRDNPVEFGSFVKLFSKCVDELKKADPTITCSEICDAVTSRGFSQTIFNRDNSRPADTDPANRGSDDPFNQHTGYDGDSIWQAFLHGIRHIGEDIHDFPQALLTDPQHYGNGDIPMLMFDRSNSRTDYCPLVVKKESSYTNRVIVDGSVMDKETGKPLEGVTVSVYLNGGKQVLKTYTIHNGYWYVQSCETSTAVYFEKEDYKDKGYYYFSAAEIGQYHRGGRALYDIKMERLDLRAGIAGMVIDGETGRPLDQVRIDYTSDHGQTGTALSGADGTFEIKDLPPGMYSFRFSKDLYGDESLVAELRGGHRTEPDEPVKMVPQRGSIRVIVLDAATGEPLPGAAIACTSRNQGYKGVILNPGDLVFRGDADDAGSRAFDHVRAGGLTLTVRKDGYADVIQSITVLPDTPAQTISIMMAPETGAEYDTGKYLFRELPNGAARIVKYLKIKSDLEIPDTLMWFPVTTIGEGVFAGCADITRVTIPYSVTVIGDRAFAGCAGLTDVSLGNSVSVIGDQAFAACTGLVSLALPPSVTSIGEDAFLGCDGLTLTVVQGSYAEQYCAERGLTYSSLFTE